MRIPYVTGIPCSFHFFLPFLSNMTCCFVCWGIIQRHFFLSYLKIRSGFSLFFDFRKLDHLNKSLKGLSALLVSFNYNSTKSKRDNPFIQIVIASQNPRFLIFILFGSLHYIAQMGNEQRDFS